MASRARPTGRWSCQTATATPSTATVSGETKHIRPCLYNASGQTFVIGKHNHGRAWLLRSPTCPVCQRSYGPRFGATSGSGDGGGRTKHFILISQQLARTPNNRALGPAPARVRPKAHLHRGDVSCKDRKDLDVRIPLTHHLAHQPTYMHHHHRVHHDGPQQRHHLERHPPLDIPHGA